MGDGSIEGRRRARRRRAGGVGGPGTGRAGEAESAEAAGSPGPGVPGRVSREPGEHLSRDPRGRSRPAPGEEDPPGRGAGVLLPGAVPGGRRSSGGSPIPGDLVRRRPSTLPGCGIDRGHRGGPDPERENLGLPRPGAEIGAGLAAPGNPARHDSGRRLSVSGGMTRTPHRERNSMDSRDLTPERIVQELDRHIIGQDAAKRVVAIAVRNRWRRQQLPAEMRSDFSPKNILLIGSTGIGKTEIARRLAQLVSAPFVKVEATRYTEVGYVGRDVESIVRDLVETSVAMVKAEELAKVRKRSEELAEERLLDLLLPRRNESPVVEGAAERAAQSRDKLREKLRSGELDNREVEVQVEERQTPFMQVFSPGGMEEVGMDMPGALGNMFPPRQVTRRVSTGEARRVLSQQEAEKLIDRERVTREGLRRAQESGMIFIDEIDKIVGGDKGSGPDVSRGGVQRDLLPIVEWATVNTRYGVVKTDYVLFIAAGAFSVSKPSDLIPELQGRFPLRAELKSLGREDFIRILTEPKSALLKQYTALLETEGIRIEFRQDAVEEMATIAADINSSTQDIGARRLHTVVENVLEELSFNAPAISPANVSIDATYVRNRLKGLLADEDIRKYIL